MTAAAATANAIEVSVPLNGLGARVALGGVAPRR